ncbi:hypothetical protein CNBE5110 [Cryptococcus deneoformans B-3501A]|uniref:hypothetical protein n=1 Tax=Cryptococcus deneoformans (strain B-3501A) TaxID=283643 RepID=UPI000042C704|nr:hypothetical protein CNBE5110 [Cryptococcus neoformans var. neoformans B-3501A]EAL20591.1 hypothetical protein CNBE5110 [Cryptococcus neoformans var. neoformans B-3501A]
MSSLAEQLQKAEKDLAVARERGLSSASKYEEKVKKLKEELAKPQPHPALQFNEVAQCISVMSAISLVMAASPLPIQLIPFYRIFSTLTICYVTRASVIYYGYQQALAKFPKQDESSSAKANKAAKKPRQDLWANMKAHPSAFLTTRQAAPRIFPFPLGKTRPEAAVREELWWEGGNAPHVGHFNRPKLPVPPNPNEDVLMKRVQASMAREAQERLWKRRIRDIQVLSVIIMVSFVSKKVAAIALAILIYRTVSSEIDDMLSPPVDMEHVWKAIDKLTGAAKNESAPKPTLLTGSTSYLYEHDGDWVKKLADVPIEGVTPPVLMTTANSWYAGPGPE